MVKLRNRSSVDLYVSVWMLDEFLSIERIFPATTSCVLLGQGREVALAVTIRQHSARDAPVRLTFKVFASVIRTDLSLLSLPRLAQSFDVVRLFDQVRRPSEAERSPSSPPQTAAKSEATTPGTWVPGGPVAVSAKVWKTGMTLGVKFLNGNSSLQRRVLEAANEWTRYANLRFEVVRKGDAELRVGFDEEGSWSYVGTDALSIPQNQPTINLGDVKHMRDPVEFRRVVLHEFGHALGLAAAQQSPVSAIPWNKKAAYVYYAREGWDQRRLTATSSRKYDRRQVT